MLRLVPPPICLFFFFFNDPATTEIYTLPLHDALPISRRAAATASSGSRCRRSLARAQRSAAGAAAPPSARRGRRADGRSEEHTSELQSHLNLVCRLLLEKKKKYQHATEHPAGDTHN